MMSHGYNPRILCVEDNHDVAGYICEMLKIAGYQTITARNLIEGVEVATKEHFDLYLFDYNLPDGTGVELCQLIRAFDRHTPILFYSNVTDPEIRRAALAAGAQGYIGKMEAFDILEQTITKLIESGRVTGADTVAQPSEVPTGMFSQEDFDRFVERYNADYYFLLLRASTGHYDCLLTSFLVLKDLNTAISKLHEVGRFEFHIIPYPITLRASEALLADLGFDEAARAQIAGFLRYIKETQGREFEEILDEGTLIYCVRRTNTTQPTI